MTKAINSQHWAVAQKALLSVFNDESGLLKSVVSALKGAPSNVTSAAGVVVTFEGTLKNLISNSKSKAKYQSAVTAASNSPKLASAEKVLDAYTQKECPGVITTTPTT
jgi:inosine/xanthosine triphosphate pyrophosphatase family protein